MIQNSYVGLDFANVWRIYENHTTPLLRTFLRPLAITADNISTTYTGQAYSGGLSNATFSVPGAGSSPYLLGRSTPYAHAVNAGSYVPDLWSSQLGYDITGINGGTLTINRAPLTVTANDASRTYDGLAYAGGNGVSYSGFVNGETSGVLGGALAYSGSAQGAKNAGSYTITPSGLTSGNYQIGYADGALTINPAALTLAAVGETRTYDGTTASSGAPTVTGAVGGDTVSGLYQLFDSRNAGARTLSVGAGYVVNDGNGGNNYTVATTTAAGAINRAPLTVTADDQSRFAAQPNPLLTATLNGFVAGESAADLSGTLNLATSAHIGSPAGSYPIVPSGYSSGNYAIAFVDGTMTVKPISDVRIDGVLASNGQSGSGPANAATAPANPVDTFNQMIASNPTAAGNEGENGEGTNNEVGQVAPANPTLAAEAGQLVRLVNGGMRLPAGLRIE